MEFDYLMNKEMAISLHPAQPLAPCFEVFGNYVLLKRLDCGGMAEIFLVRPAQASGNGRVQVIKRILPHIAKDPTF